MKTPRRCPALAVIAIAGSFLAVVAPRHADAFITPSGYLNFEPSPGAKLELNLSFGAILWSQGSGYFTGDIFLNERFSIPVGLQGYIGPYGGGLSLSAGARYRLSRIISLGGGFGGNVIFDDDNYVSALRAELYFWDYHLWLELGLGRRFRRMGISFSLRPTFHVRQPTFILFGELDLALFVSTRWALILSVVGGPGIYFNGYVGGYLGGYLGVAAEL